MDWKLIAVIIGILFLLYAASIPHQRCQEKGMMFVSSGFGGGCVKVER